MNITLVCGNPTPPIRSYGGTERVVAWLAEGLVDCGVNVTLISPKSPPIRGVKQIPVSKASGALSALPTTSDIVHFHGWVPEYIDEYEHWITTLHGNSQDLDKIPHRTCFVSKNHAERHNRKAFVYNGVDPKEFIFNENKKKHLLFFSKMVRRAKGAHVALDLANRFDFDLHFAGGKRIELLKFGKFLKTFGNNIKFLGELSGLEKAYAFANARALLFPIQWEEPFGLVVIESLLSGTPVIATRFGAIPEILTSDVATFFNSEEDFLGAFDRTFELSSRYCREYALENFSSIKMARSYLEIYSRIKDGDSGIWE